MKSTVKLFRGSGLTDALKFSTLGELELLRADKVRLRGRRKLLYLLAYLARREGVRHSRSELASLFWPESDESRSRQSLRQALAELHEVCGQGLTLGDGVVRLEANAVELDANYFEREVKEGLFEQAAARWRGDFLPGAELSWGEELRFWLEGQRERLRRSRARTGEALVTAAESRGAWAEARRHAEAWVAALPHQEEAEARVRSLRHLAQIDASPGFPRGLGLLTPDLIARDADFSLLSGLWQTVDANAAVIVFIEGEEGTGKSRLLEEFLRWLHVRSPKALRLEARAFESERDRSLILLRHLFSPLAEAKGVIAAPPSALRALQSISPEFAERFPRLGPMEPDQLPEAVARVLTEVAAEIAVVIVVDDAHLADPQSLSLLASLLHRPIPRTMLVVTALPDMLEGTDLARHSTADGRVHCVRLAAFTSDDLERMLASMGDFIPTDRARLASRLYVETGGNPRAAIELTTALADAGLLTSEPDGSWRASLPSLDAPLPLPASFRETILPRLRQLTPDARDLLDATAVLGRDATLERLITLTAQEPEILESTLAILVGRRLLRLAGPTSDHVELTYEALRRTIYESLSPLRRRELHGRAARALRERGHSGLASARVIAYHRERSGASPRRSRWAVVTVLAVVILGAAVARRAYSIRTQLPPPTRVVALASFTAQDSQSTEFIPVVPQLLSQALGDVRGIRMVGAFFPDSSASRATDATEALSGVISRSGDAVRLDAALREIAAPHRVVARASVTGPIGQIGTLSAAMARTLAGPDAGPTGMSFQLESAHTTSIEALEDYVEGERLASRREMRGAALAFWRARKADPTFAAAWHAQAEVNSFYWQGDRAGELADSAAAHVAGLSPEDAQLMLGWQSFAHGDADDAERRFRAVRSYASETAEPNVGLGEVLFHHNWSRGRDPAESRPYWEAAARINSSDWRPTFHLWALAARDHRLQDAAGILARAVAVSGDSAAVAGEQLVLAALVGDSMLLRVRLNDLARESEWNLTSIATDLVVIADLPEVSRSVVEELANARRAPEIRAFGHELLAQLALAQGKWRVAGKELDQARATEPVSAATVRAILSIAPFLPESMDSGTIRGGAIAALAHAPLSPVKRTFVFWFDMDRTREWAIRPYLQRLLAFDMSNQARLIRIPGAPFPDSLVDLERHLQRSLDAHRAAAAGDTATTLMALEDGWSVVEASRTVFSAAYGRPWDLYLKARLLESSGHLEEALRWYGCLGANSIADYAYVAPAAFRRGLLFERLHRPDDARREYRRFVRLWHDADREFQPRVDSARARLVSLNDLR